MNHGGRHGRYNSHPLSLFPVELDLISRCSRIGFCNGQKMGKKTCFNCLQCTPWMQDDLMEVADPVQLGVSRWLDKQAVEEWMTCRWKLKLLQILQSTINKTICRNEFWRLHTWT